MSSVVFLRAVNVGGTNRCQPAIIAKQLGKFDVINIGAVGTFVVRKNVIESILRKKIAVQLAKTFGVKCEIMICPAKKIVDLTRNNPFPQQPFGPDITRFVSVAAKPLGLPFRLPLNLPSDDDWLLKVFSIRDRFVLGVYRRQMKAISYLGKVEKLLAVPVTTRSWNTIEKVTILLRDGY